ncbi:MAG: ribosome maturation factor RimM [Desulfovibrio sp.]|nr:ribosome maturation factor RimM [Desulfovibrio sp.]
MSSSASDTVPLVPVGHLCKAHGIRGELVFVLTADSPALLNGELILKAHGREEGHRLMVERLRRHHDKWIISFKGIGTRNEAELLCRHTAFVPQDRLPPLEDGEVYLSDLPGLRVVLAGNAASVNSDADHVAMSAQREEREIGVILSVDVPAGQELWTILTPDGREILFPAVKPFVISIDPEQGRAVIAPPPGLLELYLADA